jgi:hypothetical protein
MTASLDISPHSLVKVYRSFTNAWVVSTFFYGTTTKSVAPETEGSLPHSQKPTTNPYPGPLESAPHPQPILPRSILMSSSNLHPGRPSGLFPSMFRTKTLYTFLSSPMRATCPAHHFRLVFITLMILREWVQIMKLLIVQLPLFSCYLIPLKSKYFPQNTVLKHPHSKRLHGAVFQKSVSFILRMFKDVLISNIFWIYRRIFQE